MSMKFSRLGRSSGSIELPETWATPLEVSRLLDHTAKMVCDEWLARCRTMAVAPDDAPNAWLERTCYALVMGYIKSEAEDAFEARIEQYQRKLRGPRSSGTIFQTALMAITAHQGDAISAGLRERVGKRLWHAYRHYVPPVFLNGFFKQIGSKDLPRRATDEEIEPGFDEWIAEQLAQETNFDSRGTYPGRILAIIPPSKERDFDDGYDGVDDGDDDPDESGDDHEGNKDDDDEWFTRPLSEPDEE
ncbi:hypothetical protein KZX46_04390 [Polymorphobacter sp. PAMC 29334]|uniref:hypothetical protein n=1 Tax=Polymorphobacter sp. PAMC 29334 TaxID=2862331 RepID=UPI001C7904B1|nr:hypothetical protein [Polymorphobacter sp. PAMC 29334]QYE35246.1 hypothetical protein KZX46_04390 [Polymorphobacter sp. PAMC 29334]